MLDPQKRRQLLSVVSPPADTSAQERISDDELLARLRRGDATVGRCLYWRVRPVVVRTVRRLLGTLDRDAADMVQITLLQLVEALPRYRGECPLDAWISSVSAHAIYKHIRRRRLERTLFLDATAGLDNDSNRAQAVPLPSQTAEARELAARVGQHLSRMNADRAWVYLLHDVQGYSLEEIAHITGTSTASTQSRLSRGRRDLHRRIAKDPALASLLKQEGGEA